MPDGNELRRARDRLLQLDRERAALLRSIARLNGVDGPDIGTADGRVQLFASLLRGRPDVFATRWESTKTPGRSGWAPRCANEWQPGRCLKPKVKCAECANRGFVAFTHAQVRRHLEGHQTMRSALSCSPVRIVCPPVVARRCVATFNPVRVRICRWGSATRVRT